MIDDLWMISINNHQSSISISFDPQVLRRRQEVRDIQRILPRQGLHDVPTIRARGIPLTGVDFSHWGLVLLVDERNHRVQRFAGGSTDDEADFVEIRTHKRSKGEKRDRVTSAFTREAFNLSPARRASSRQARSGGVGVC